MRGCARARAAIVATAILGLGSEARAQVVAAEPGARLEVEGGVGVLEGGSLGTGDANLRPSRQTGQPFRLFTASSRFERARAFHVRAAYALTRRFGVESRLTIAHPDIRTTITADAESAPRTVGTERIDAYLVDAGLVMMLYRFGIARRAVPFVSGGAGYLRQLHEGQTVIEQGQVYYAGGGIKSWLTVRDHGLIRAAGLRADVRMNLLRGGISFGESPRPQLAVSGGVFVGF